MTATRSPEYRKLELESSNDLIRHDARRGDGKYPEAAWHALQAGAARDRMGRMMFDAGECVFAVADWLSASACFLLATDPKRMREAFERARQLDREENVPPERGDIRAALKERAEQVQALEQKLARFEQEYRKLVDAAHPAGPSVLDWLLRQVRDLPGLPRLHAEIAARADQLGQPALAAQHREWAEKLAPGSGQPDAARAPSPLADGDAERAPQRDSVAPLCDAPSTP